MGKLKQYLYIIGGLICVGLGALGVVTPGLPTTPFLLLASWLFFRSSQRLQQWLLASWLGKYICDYERDKGMSVSAKVGAISMLVGMCTISIVFFLNGLWPRLIVGIAGAIGFIVVGFVVPTVHRNKEK